MSNRPTPQYYEKRLSDEAKFGARMSIVNVALRAMYNADYAMYPDFEAIDVVPAPVVVAPAPVATGVARPIIELTQRESERQFTENEQYIDNLRTAVLAEYPEDSHEYPLSA